MESSENGSAWERLRAALREPDYRCLMAGFSTCGFHMCIVQTHISSQILSYGLSENVAALSYTVFGVAGMIGSVLSGILCQRFRMKNVLALFYGLRSVIIVAFLFGVVFVCHQIGGFISAWAGGVFIAGGNYAGIWFAGIVLCAFASFVSWLIRSRD